MVLRMGKTLEARTMPGWGGRRGRERDERRRPPGHGHGIGQQPRGGGLEALPPGFEHSHQALETLVRWELRLVGQLDQMQVRTQACWVSLHPRTPSGLESHCPRLA